jgi:hypothetical protein
METNLTIIILLSAIFALWLISVLPRKINLNDVDYRLVKNYHIKPSYKKKVVLIIEAVVANGTNLDQLLTLVRNILTQNIKIDSIVLISQDESLNKVQLIQNTCILNKIGGLSFLLKESGNDTTLVFIFIDGYDNFKDPHFLNKFLESKNRYNGLVQVDTNSVKVDINKVYETSS